MTFDRVARADLLAIAAPGYLEVIDHNIQREFPYMPWLVVTSGDPLPHHRELHPVFYGCFDWHSCVEMWWAAIRILRVVDGVDSRQIRATMDRLLTADGIATESAFFANPQFGGFERPYGWGWLLTLQHELDTWDDEQGQRWAQTLRPLSTLIAGRLTTWLPKLPYPQRHGLHPNTAFSLARSVPYATARAKDADASLLVVIEDAAHRFYRQDRDYPAAYEPGGADFLSGALSEAELMSLVLDPTEYLPWLDQFLPQLHNALPRELFEPVRAPDASDGQLAHLTGLNLSRAAGFLAIASRLTEDDLRLKVLIDAAEQHAQSSLGAVTGSDYMEEHWLAAYAVLMLTA